MHRFFAYLAVAASLCPAADNNGVEAAALFARIKGMAGEWEQKSTKGWTGGYKVRVLAKGSAVLLESRIDDAPDQGMATLFYIDHARLLLTHYCEARNQPTLVATSTNDNGNTVIFEFLTGTGMLSRDIGHMDRLVLKFLLPDGFTEQWSWYQSGKQTPFEEIACRRIAQPASAPREH